MAEPVIIGNATLYLGSCEDILPTLPKADAVVTDPPYGILDITGDAVVGRKNPSWGMWDNDRDWDKSPVAFIDEVVAAGENAIVWGGHLYDLPPKRGWLLWDKIVREFSSGHAEMAWTTLDQPVRAFNFSHGQLANEGKVHPTQKPLALMRWCLGFLPDANTILDPFMGSGTTGVAALQMGRKFIGIEREPRYFEAACRRIRETTGEDAGPLFGSAA